MARATKLKRSSIETASLDMEKKSRKTIPGLNLGKIDAVLSPIFHILWILIGAFFILIIIGQIRQGALNSVFGPAQVPAESTAVDTPIETDLPGVGTVNIACVQESLSTEAIQKLIESQGTSTLSAEEKSQLEPCIVATPSPSPTQ